MLPYLAQGANSAVEDGAVLGLLLGHIQSKNQLPKALNMYEELRKSRGEAIVRETFKQVRDCSNRNIDLLFPNIPTA
jgi:salicylate hydroxylase